MSSNASRVTFQSCDGEEFVVDKEIAMAFFTIRPLIQSDFSVNIIPFKDIDGETLNMLVDYCRLYVKAGNEDSVSSKNDLKAWEQNLIEVVPPLLMRLMKAAHFLKIETLFDLTCRTAANAMEGKTSEEIRVMFNIKKDFSEEEISRLESEESYVKLQLDAWPRDLLDII